MTADDSKAVDDSKRNVITIVDSGCYVFWSPVVFPIIILEPGLDAAHYIKDGKVAGFAMDERLNQASIAAKHHEKDLAYHGHSWC